MKNARSLVLGLCAFVALAVSSPAHAASVGVGGYTNAFVALPPTTDWSTFSIAGDSAAIGADAQMDAAVALLTAANFTAALTTDAANPPGSLANGQWSSGGGYVQTRPTGNAATAVMLTLSNGLGVEAVSVTMSYDFAQVAVDGEQVASHRAYYSLTGAAGSWTVIPSFSGGAPGRLSATLNIIWPAGAPLYVIWADDNATPASPDTAMQIDNFSATAAPGVQTPVTITNDPDNLTVAELAPSSFTVAVSGYLPPTWQWYTNGVAAAGATNTTYSFASTPLAYHGMTLQVIAQNVANSVTYFATSTVATLSVNADVVAPVLLEALPAGLSTVVVAFSEPLLASSVTNRLNYSITNAAGSLTISNAVLDGSLTNVILTISPMTPTSNYTLTVNMVRDLSAAGNVVATNSQAQFTAGTVAYVDIGSPSVPGVVSSAGGGVNMTAGGTNIIGNADQFTFSYQQVAGDFDTKVRVEGLTASEAWSLAGLMARESLSANSVFAAAMATPSISGCFFLQRSSIGGQAAFSGSSPVNYPYTWLRLRRVGNTFTAFSGYDGQSWVQMGSATIAMSTAVYVGYAACGTSVSGASTATAQFRDAGTAVGGTEVAFLPRTVEPVGPSTRRTALTISEIMYHQRARTDGRVVHFVEVFNSGMTFEDIGGFRLSGDISYTFAPGTILPAGGYLVVAAAPGDVQAVYGITGVLGPYSNTLSQSSGTVRLRNRQDAILVEVEYLSVAPWPVAPDGAGPSLALTRPSYGELDTRAWGASDLMGGSPGRAESMGPEPLRSLVINEFFARSEFPAQDFIELYNRSTAPLNISGAWLSDSPSTNKFRIPDGTVLPARGFISFTESQLGFGLDSFGEKIFLVNSNQNRILDVWQFDVQAATSTGRSPDGSERVRELSASTPGTTNAAPLAPVIVINEIMFDPISGDDDDEFIELHNRTTNNVDISGWRFTDGIDYTFPSNTVMAGGAYFVVAKSKTRLQSNHPSLSPTNLFGNYNGTLKNRGERVIIARPDTLVSTNNGGGVVTNTVYVTVNDVTYAFGGQWGEWSKGGGSSLELRDPNSDNHMAPNWGDSDETQKSGWTTVETFNGLLDNGQGAINEVQVMLLGRGEALMDNVEVYAGSNTPPNLVNNSGFESGTTGWFLGGNHIRSSQENEGQGGSTKSLHLRASSGGDNGANRVEHDLSTTLVDNNRATLRGKFRWLRGNPHVLMRFHGNQLEASGILPIPANLGTPGAPNSIRTTNFGPAIVEVAHSPVSPAASQPVVVTATVHDTDGLQSVSLRYRLDPILTYTSVPMLDNGTGGDALAGDGIYSATIPGQASGSLIAFHVRAVDAAAVAASNSFPVNVPVNECHVRFGDPAIFGSVAAYRLWMSSSNITHWGSREKLSNEPLDSTFVYGNFRAIYGAGGRYRGSPFLRPSYNTPTGTRCAYVWSLPEDQPFLNTDEINLDSMEPGDRDSTILREVTSFKIAEELNLSYSYQRFVHTVVNGVTDTSRGVPAYTDVQQPNGDYIDSWFPEQNVGDIFKIDDWFEFDDNTTGPAREFNVNARLQNFITPGGATSTPGGVKKQARYRWSWEKKVLGGLDDDYSSLFAFVDALNAADPLYTQQVEAYMDTEAWLTEIMLRHLVGDWDGYGYDRGKNTFAYKPRDGKWRLLLWDLDFSLGCTGGHPPTQNMFQSEDPTMTKLLNHPPFRRIYFRAMQRAADGPLLSSHYLPLLEARFRALQANGITSVSPFVNSGAQGITVPAWIDQRRANVLGQIPAATFAVTTASVTSTTNLVTVTGNAPIGIKTIRINGVDWPVIWTGVTAWSVRFPLAGSGPLNIVGVDINGAVVTTTNTINATFTGTSNSPVGQVVFNEIMANPLVPSGEYIELFNTSSNYTFDLGGWRINGLDYTFPGGSYIGPRSYVVLARDRVAFWTAFGYNVTVLDTFNGDLQASGETLTLIKPAASTNETDLVVDKVRYDGAPPWPGTSFGIPGSSFQLIDNSQDNVRAGNWYALADPPVYTPEISTPAEPRDGWRFVSATGTLNPTNAMRLVMYLGEVGSALVDDLSIVAGTNAAVGTNHVRNGDFESALLDAVPVTNSWLIGTNYTNSLIVGDLVHAGAGALKIIGTFPGTIGFGGTVNRAMAQWLYPLPVNPSTALTTNTLSFWYWATNSATNLFIRVLGTGASGLSSGPGSSATNINIFYTPSNYVPPTLISGGYNTYSPGVANQWVTNFPTFEPLWINEVQAENLTGPLDNQGEREPWIEIYNTSTNTVSLEGLYLTQTFTNYTNWVFPPGSSIGPTQFLVVICDGEAGETAGSEYHTSFRLNAASGQVALSRLYTNAPQVLDYLHYAGLHADKSYGSFPDGQPFDRQEFYYVTPAGANDGRSAPLLVFINEWMAQNSSVLADPADGQYEDWFELYNPSTNAIDLAGYYLTDVLAVTNKFLITTNMAHIVPPQGYLLVWADNEANQNTVSGVIRPDLHVNFSLAAGGEAIGLFAEDGTQVDAIIFGQQTNNVSQGRFPDGTASLYFMPESFSPRTANYLPGLSNTAPVLAFIGSKVIYLGQTLAFTATATDSDVPAQILGFQLVAPIPPGAIISPSGAFSWTPGSLGTNSVTVRVVDNGVPQMNDSETFTVEVLAAPSFSSSVRDGDNLVLTWGTRPGKAYAVDYKNDLNAAQWLPLWTNVASGNSLSFTNVTTNAPQEFYRIRTVN